MTTLIIGGGLSGLALANGLLDRDQPFLLVEARTRFGGRIKTEQHACTAFDMGPAWFWPGQPRIATLIARLGLTKFDQFADGVMSYENEHGTVSRGQGFASMEGSWRLAGGLSALTGALAQRIPASHKRLNCAVSQLAQDANGITATLAQGEVLHAERAVLALPPRIAATMSFAPVLPAQVMKTMQNTATWMAGQAKAVAVYDTPFWRDAGLSGDATSRKGPMVEIHDASPTSGGLYALFGFIGVPPHARRDEALLHQHLVAQLVRLFGTQAAEPKCLFVKDWAFDPHTATHADHAPLTAHPTYGLPKHMRGVWQNRLHFSGTEVAPEFGGYIEGALEAAENTLRAIAPSEHGAAHDH